MAKHKNSLEEAFGPALDGTEDVARLARSLLEPMANVPEPEEDEEAPPEPILLICGGRQVATDLAALARQCGFLVELAVAEAPDAEDDLALQADSVHVLENFDNLVDACDISRNHYVCVFVKDGATCEHILQQCLSSDAAYVGAWAELDLRNDIFARLKAAGAPDAELAAICCPIGLAVGAVTSGQQAVAIMAEVLAAKSGVLKRLRFSD